MLTHKHTQKHSRMHTHLFTHASNCIFKFKRYFFPLLTTVMPFYAIYFVAPLYIDYTIKHIIEHRISCTEKDMLIIALMCFYTNVNLQYLENVFKSIYTQPLFSTDK